jgi:phosphate transport system protein
VTGTPHDVRDELSRVSRTLVTMARAVRETMRQASTALLTANHSMAQEVVDRGAEIDVLYRVVEDRVYDLVAEPEPVSGDLRIVLSSFQMAADLRRMGDLSVHVARSALRRQPAPAVGPELSDLFRAMSAVADDLVGKIVAALSGNDAVLAAQLDRDDDAMDQLHRQLFSVMLSPDWPLGVEAAIDGALLGRYYERYADHAVNVGRRIVYLVTGKTD